MPYLHHLGQEASDLIPRKPVEAMSEAVEEIVARTADVPSRILKRAPSSTTSSSSSTCSSGSSDCKKSSGSNITLPVVLAVVLPILFAIAVFFYLHRKNLRRLRSEDANDPHKSLDFGMGDVATRGQRSKRGNKIPEMSVHETEKEIRRGRGLSMDMGISNPYLLPPGLQSSRESLHSLSRSLNSGDDRYRPATIFHPNDRSQHGSYPNSLRNPTDDGSSFTGSSRRGFPMNDSSQNLMRNAQRMSLSMPPTRRESMESGNSGPHGGPTGSGLPKKPNPPQPLRNHLSPIEQNGPRSSYNSDLTPDNQALRNSNVYLGQYIRSGAPAAPELTATTNQPIPRSSATPPPPPPPKEASPSPPRKSPPQTLAGLPSNPKANRNIPRSSSPVTVPDVSPFKSDEDAYADGQAELPSLPAQDFDFESKFRVDPPAEDRQFEQQDKKDDHDEQKYDQDFGYDVRRLTMGIRPLPPDDPSENPEQRANRIRSFYKEYFDDSTPGPVYSQDAYYGDEHADMPTYDAPLWDPDSGQFITGTSPYAEPITRRAMTPPPRGPPRFRGAAGHQATYSGSDFTAGSGPRAYSSASGGFGPRGRPPPKKAAPPPKPLMTLPTPHMLSMDTLIPFDFAPPQSYNERLRGASPDSPKGSMRSFSPSVRPHKALVSSFDDLAIMPSPHALRKSGTFTSLDFALPPRFKNAETASDSGSIRSNRSGISTVQLQSIRAGAYRLSRMPKDQVGTRDDLSTALKPSWNMRN